MNAFHPVVEVRSCECIYALRFSPWKRKYVRLALAREDVRFVEALDDVPERATILTWGRSDLDLSAYSVLRVEDGFLRSVGLGADLVRPLSWVVDSDGIYFDATQPSRLEAILQHDEFDAELLQRAALLRQRIVDGRLSKYNVGSHVWERPATEKRIVLVVGQVESDASLTYGSPDIRTNLDLLQKVRSACVDDYVIYKPHPDVVAGMRKLGNREAEALGYCDEVVTRASISDVLAVVDEVHVMTSLAGFEALMRGKRVVCHGLPFYAGWGLTEDRASCSRRNRRLTLEQLVAGALICYPVYFDRAGERMVSPEIAVDTLLSWRGQSFGREPWWNVLWRMILRRIVGVR